MGQYDEAELKRKQAPKLDQYNKAVAYYMALLEEARSKNDVGPGNGREAIVRKLRGIKLGEVPDGFEQGLPLSEVLNILTKLAISKDVDHSGVNFLFNPRVGGNAAGELVDPSVITIKITPRLRNVNLLQMLDAIRHTADQPIDFSVADYAVWFFVKPPANAPLESRLQPLLNPSPGTSQDRQAVMSETAGPHHEGTAVRF